MSAGGGSGGNSSTYCEACRKNIMNKHMTRHKQSVAHVKAEAALPVCIRCGVKTLGWGGTSMNGRIYCKTCVTVVQLERTPECEKCHKKTFDNKHYDDVGSDNVGKVFCMQCHRKVKLKIVAGDPEKMAVFILELLDRVTILESKVTDLDTRYEY